MNKIRTWGIFIFIAAFLIVFSAATQQVQKPGVVLPFSTHANVSKPTPKPTRSATVSVLIQKDALEEAKNSLLYAKNMIHTIIPTWFTVTKDGNLVETSDETYEQFQKNNIPSSVHVTPLVQINEYDVANILESEASVSAILSLIREAKNKNYSGYVFGSYTPSSPVLTKEWTAFLALLSTALQREGKTFSASIMLPKPEEKNTASSIQYFQQLGSVVDHIFLFFEEYEAPSEDPKPLITQKDFAEKLQFATEIFPKNTLTVLLPSYSIDWKNKESRLSFTFLNNFLTNQSISLKRDTDSWALSGVYLEENSPHIVWTTDAKTILTYMDFATKFGIKNVAIDWFGYEDRMLWNILQEK